MPCALCTEGTHSMSIILRGPAPGKRAPVGLVRPHAGPAGGRWAMKPPRRLFRRSQHPPDIREIRADSQEEPQRFRARSSPEADQALAAMPEDAVTVLLTVLFARHQGLDLVTADRGVFDLA